MKNAKSITFPREIVYESGITLASSQHGEILHVPEVGLVENESVDRNKICIFGSYIARELANWFASRNLPFSLEG